MKDILNTLEEKIQGFEIELQNKTRKYLRSFYGKNKNYGDTNLFKEIEILKTQISYLRDALYKLEKVNSSINLQLPLIPLEDFNLEIKEYELI